MKRNFFFNKIEVNNISNALLKTSDLFDEIDDQHQCANCESNDIITDENRGEKICSQCGLVIEDRMIDVGSEWRAYNQD